MAKLRKVIKIPGGSTDIKREVMRKQKRQAMHKKPSFSKSVFLEYKMVLNSTLGNKLLIHSLSKHIYLMPIWLGKCSNYWDYIIEQKTQSVFSGSLHFTGGDGHKDK